MSRHCNVIGEYDELTDAKAKYEELDTMIWRAIKKARNYNKRSV